MGKKTSLLSIIILLAIIGLGLFLRLKWWPKEVTFGYEQARDAIVSTKIFTEKKLTLIGPTTEVEGLFHGPIYYYLIGLVYFVFGPNPSSVSLLHILFNLACIPLIYLFARKLFGNRAGLLAAFLFSISYEVVSYSLWLSNPSLGLPFIILAYFFLYKSLTENQKFLPLALLFLSISISFDMIIVVHLLSFIALYFIYIKQKISLRNWVVSIAAFILPLINYPFFEIKHKFFMSNVFLKLLKSQDSHLKSIFEYIVPYLNGLAKEFANLFFPIHGFFAGILMFVLLLFLIYKLRSTVTSKTPWAFVLIILLANLPTFLITAAITNSEFSFFGVNCAAVLLLSAFLDYLLTQKKKILVLGMVFFVCLGSFHAWKNYLTNPQKKLFDSQRGVIIKDTIAVINYTYSEAKGQPFFVDAVTVPLFISPLWDYLYSWYGKEKFAYLPIKNNSVSIQFLIIEPGWGQTYDIFKLRAIENMNKTTALEETKTFGSIIVEKRSLKGSTSLKTGK